MTRPFEIVIIADECAGRHRDVWPGVLSESVSIAIEKALGFLPRHRADA